MGIRLNGDLEQEGFAILPGVFGTGEIESLIHSLSHIADEKGVRSRGGVYAIRNLLQLSAAVRELASSAKVCTIAAESLHGAAAPVRATLFDKTAGANWLVPWHQDLTICVKARLDVPGYGPWTKKAGVWHVQPPVRVLERMVSFRIHLDDCGESNGALRVIPGSHGLGRLNGVQIAEVQRTADAVTCVVDAGDVLLMGPLLLHASSAASQSKHRRVIHIDYAACQLDGGLEWREDLNPILLAILGDAHDSGYTVYDLVVIRRFYVHNYRCLENFDLPVADQSSVLLIGNNGSGKSTASFALEVLQKIGRGTNRVGQLVVPSDLTRGLIDTPMRFEIEVTLDERVYRYSIAFELPKGFKELRIKDESLKIDGAPVFQREVQQVHLARPSKEDAKFVMDWHMVALPILQQEPNGTLLRFREWLATRLLILRPTPALIRGRSDDETLAPTPDVTNFGDWFSGLLALSPKAYETIDRYLRRVMPDFWDIQKPLAMAQGERSLVIQFKSDEGSLKVPFERLSDGEKCFAICSLVLAAKQAYGPLVCFWDEPDNYLALSEVGHFVLALRQALQQGSQFIATSHNPEAIRSFSDENTLVLYRKSHLEPTLIRRLSEFHVNGDLIGALTRGDLL